MFTANCGKPGPRVTRQLCIPCPQHSGNFKGVVQVRISDDDGDDDDGGGSHWTLCMYKSGVRCWQLLEPFCHEKCGLTEPFMGEEESMPCKVVVVHVLKVK